MGKQPESLLMRISQIGKFDNQVHSIYITYCGLKGVFIVGKNDQLGLIEKLILLGVPTSFRDEVCKMSQQT